jgi:uncharacterized protein (UPF0261 family)
VLLIMPHIGYGGIVYAGADRFNMASRACVRYIHSLRRLDRVSYLETSVMGVSLSCNFCRFFVVLHV